MTPCRKLALVQAIVTSLLLVACAATPRPCRSPSACPDGTECLANRCLPLGAEPVAPDSQRVVLDPVAVAVVRAGAAPRGSLPPTVTFGGPPNQNEQLLVAFAHSWSTTDIDAAFLLLEPALDAEPSTSDVEIGVAIAASQWTSGATDEQPASHGPRGDGVGRTRPPAPLRIDVTALIREISKQPRSTHGLLVRAAHPSPRGAVYSTGLDGPAPRLDLYVRRRVPTR